MTIERVFIISINCLLSWCNLSLGALFAWAIYTDLGEVGWLAAVLMTPIAITVCLLCVAGAVLPWWLDRELRKGGPNV